MKYLQTCHPPIFSHWHWILIIIYLTKEMFCPLSWKLFKLDEPDMQDTAGEAGMNS